MPISGKVYIVPNPDEKTWQLVVHNTGDQPIGITQNIMPEQQKEVRLHDDNGAYGHGLGVNPGKVSWQKFHLGDNYSHGGRNQHPITEECFLRVGIRNLCYQTLQLPELNGPPVELDIADFNWYGGNAKTSRAAYNNSPGRREHRADVADGDQVLFKVEQLLEQFKTNGVTCEGQVKVTPVNYETGGLSHWEVRFDNTGEQAFIGTVTFVDAEKNDGIGLESMALPKKDSAAMQRIEYLGNYGLEAQPGKRLRLGVRGYSWTEIDLPEEGEIVIPLDKFRLDTSKMDPEYFDEATVEEKRNEKRDKVQFFQGGEAINDSLEPTTHRGAKAIALSTYDPPRLKVQVVEDTRHTPGGGWIVGLQSTLPEFDDDGRRLGFAAAVLLDGADPRSETAKSLGPKKLQYPGHEKFWFIPKNQDLGGAQAEVGAKIKVATRGLGWFAEVELPAEGTVVDSKKDDELWGLREDQYSRRLLTPRAVNRYRG